MRYPGNQLNIVQKNGNLDQNIPNLDRDAWNIF